MDQCEDGVILEVFEACSLEVLQGIFIPDDSFSLLGYRVAENVAGQGQKLSSILAARLG